VSLDGVFGPVEISYRDLRALDLRVRGAADMQAAIDALSTHDQTVMAYNFLPGTATSVLFGPCAGGDPDECDHTANPTPPPPAEVEQPPPPPPAPTIRCGDTHASFSQTDLAHLVLYTFYQDSHRCFDGTNVVNVYAYGGYSDEGWGWSCDWDQVWPRTDYVPPTQSGTSVTVATTGFCHADVNFDVLGRKVSVQLQKKHPGITISVQGNGGAVIVRRG
jgi:hypothetical protein